MKLFGSKRGVSPLIATVLLIAFAIALGAVVMSWGRNYVQDVSGSTTQSGAELQCADVAIGIPVISGDKKICISGNSAEFLIENNGIKPVQSLKISVYGSTGVDNPVVSLDPALLDAAIASKTVDFEDVGNIQQLKIIPVIKHEGKDHFCTLSAIEIINPKTCE